MARARIIGGFSEYPHGKRSPEHSPRRPLRYRAGHHRGGRLLGAATNAVNGAVSPVYFINILHWEYVENIWRAAVAQGIFEGLIYGTIFAIIFTLVVGSVSRARATFRFALKHLIFASGVALLCWCLGGALALGLATLSPDFYRSTFIGVPREFGPMLRYAWVGGSIWGVLFGAVLSVVIACTMAAADWRRRKGPGKASATLEVVGQA